MSISTAYLTYKKDQVPSILKYVGDGIHSLTQFRNFIKERSSIEREYAQKLDTLSRKYKTHNRKTGNTTDQQQEDWDWDDTSRFEIVNILNYG